MSVLTKVFVVLVTILSVILVSVMVTFVVNQENWKKRFDGEQSQRKLAEKRARAAEAEQEAHQDRKSADFMRLSNANDLLTQQLQFKSDDAVELGVLNARLAAEKIRLNTQASQLTAQNQILAEMTKQQRDELDATRTALNRARTDLIKTVDLVNEKTTKVEILEQELRHAQERLASVIDENEQLLHKIRKANIREDEPVEREHISPTPIEGNITMVRSRDETTYVQVDVGSIDGVEPKMQFLVHQDSQFKGTLVIDLVDAQSASGKMTLVEQDIAEGDRVWSGPIH